MSTGSSGSSCVPGVPSVFVQQWGQEDFVINYHRGYRLVVRASNPCNMEKEIFRYTVVRTDPQTGEHEYELSGVCTWADMEQYPKYEPDQEADPQVVRLDYVDIVLDTEDIALEAWDVLKSEIDRLVNTIAAGETLSIGEELEFSGEVGAL